MKKAMPKPLKIIIITAVLICAMIILFIAGIYAYLFIGQSLLEKNTVGKQVHITEITELENEISLPALPTDCATGCDCYYTIDAADMLMGVDCYHIFGRINLTQDCYDKLLDDYKDFKPQRGVPNLYSLYDHRSVHYDDMTDFINSAANKDFLYSQDFFDESHIVMLLSADDPSIWFCELYFS